MTHEGREGVVMIVEDEKAIRTLVARFLLSSGLNSAPVSCSEEAMDRLAVGGVALVLIDIALGDESGVDLMYRIRGTYPLMPMVFVTGYPDRSIEYPDVPMVTKPINVRELVSTVIREIRNRCRDVQLKETRELAGSTHVILKDVHTLLVHPETGLAATHEIAKAAATRGMPEMILDLRRNPIVVGLIGAVLLLGGALAKMQADDANRLRATVENIAKTVGAPTRKAE